MTTRIDVGGPTVARERRIVALRDLAVAPENLRFGEPADELIPELAATIRAAGVLQPLTVRPGRRKEAPWMALDGRRRLLALGLLADAGEIDGSYEMEVFVETEAGRQAAAAVLTNTAAPVHVADVIVAIGRMLKAGLDAAAISAALGYAASEIRKLGALSSMPKVAIEALRAGRLTLKQARLVARLRDRKAQTEIARAALDGYGFQDWRVREILAQGQVDTDDPRWRLVGAARYAAAGGRVEADLFGELPDRLLDPEILTTAWTERAGRVADILAKDGLKTVIAIGDGWEQPEGLEPFGYVRSHELQDADAAAYREAREAHETEANAARALDPEGDAVLVALAGMLRARARLHEAGAPGRAVKFLALRPDSQLGVDAICLADPAPVAPPAKSDSDAPDAAPEPGYPPVDVSGLSHAQHRARTEMSTLGLARFIADDPQVALIGLTARLFGVIVLREHLSREESATVVMAEMRRGRDERCVETLNGEVERRLAERRTAHMASGRSPLDWIAGLDEVERLALLAELFAATLDLREDRTDRLRHAARAEARVLARLSDADLSVHWTPDAAFLNVHGKPQLLDMLEAMGEPVGKLGALRKSELVERAALEAAARRWIPDGLRWGAEPDGEGATTAPGNAPGAEARPGNDEGAKAPTDNPAIAA